MSKCKTNIKLELKTTEMWFLIHVQAKKVIVKYVCKENIMDTWLKFGYTKTNEKIKKKTEERKNGKKEKMQ